MLVLAQVRGAATRELNFDLVLAVVVLETGRTNEGNLAVSGDADLLVIYARLNIDGVRLAVIGKSSDSGRDVVVLAGCSILRYHQSC